MFGLVVGALGACSTDPSPSPTFGPLVPVALPGGDARFARAVLAEPLVPRFGPAPDGPEMLTQPDGQPQPLEAGRKVVILGVPQPGPGGTWVRVWIEEDLQTSPSDMYAWLPMRTRGVDRLVASPQVACPATATIESLAPLVQQDRLRCAGRTEITLDARTGRLPLAPLYDVDPVWYGRNQDPVTTLFNPGPIRFGPGARTTPDQAGAWINARVPPNVSDLPLGVFVRVTGRFDDPSAAGCTRRIRGAVPNQGPPVEAPTDSVQWCREQFVVSEWHVLLGPEGRPLDVTAPQLHRREFVVPPGMVEACGGVGMSILTIRIDPTQVDPVWVESGPDRQPSLAVFGPEFALALDPPRIQATTGVTLVDGEQIDPDRGKPGLAVCPGGETIWFAVPKP